MTDNAGPLVCGNVLLRPASGATIDGSTVITADNIRDYTPSAETIDVTTRYFGDQGFQVGPAVGISFAVTAPKEHFEKLFGASLQRNEQGMLQVVDPDDGSFGYELPLDRLPDGVRSRVIVVALEEPTSFGPSDFA